jgi:hypothetical protein
MGSSHVWRSATCRTGGMANRAKTPCAGRGRAGQPAHHDRGARLQRAAPGLGRRERRRATPSVEQGARHARARQESARHTTGATASSRAASMLEPRWGWASVPGRAAAWGGGRDRG